MNLLWKLKNENQVCSEKKEKTMKYKGVEKFDLFFFVVTIILILIFAFYTRAQSNQFPAPSHQKIQSAQGSSQLQIYDDVAHGCQMLNGLVPEATDPVRQAAEFIHKHTAIEIKK